MRNTLAGILFSCVVAAVPCVHAQDEDTPEGQAMIKKGEVGRLERDSIGEYGPLTRFNVAIVWSDDAGQRPSDHKSRIVRYVADCKAGTLTVAAVAVFDRSGALVKRMMAPPGASDPITPEAGSPQAKWLKDVCVD